MGCDHQPGTEILLDGIPISELCIPEGIQFDVSRIPRFRREDLARGALELTRRVFSQPGAEERYQEWLKERKKNLAAAAAQ